MERLTGTLVFMPRCFKIPIKRSILQLSARSSSPLRRATKPRCIHSDSQEPNYNDQVSPNHLNPSPSSYSITPFTDHCIVEFWAGHGGHGCVSFVREKYIPDGPPNGGDGGSGGGIYIQAVRGETSLKKLSRKRELRAGKGKNGRGKNQRGERGDDVLFTVPVGTIVKEISRYDPVDEQGQVARLKQLQDEAAPMLRSMDRKRTNLITYPGAMRRSDFEFGKSLVVPKISRPALAVLQMPAPISLDLDSPMDQPMLLAAGAAGGLGNLHFVTKDFLRPKYATRGEAGLRLTLSFELKMLADVGLVGLPNAGKSTLLRSLSNSRTRVGNWAFTTLQPNIGTVVLDNYKGRPLIESYENSGQLRTSFTIADIPGLTRGAHKNKGLGLGFLRHVERASILTFVLDLSAGDAIAALKMLWAELAQYDVMKDRELNTHTEVRMAHMFERKSSVSLLANCPISSKPWFVVATKADLAGTQSNFAALKAYIDEIRDGTLDHPSMQKTAWRSGVVAIPVSAINAQGVDKIRKLIVDLL